jgi:hypothetical protein
VIINPEVYDHRKKPAIQLDDDEDIFGHEKDLDVS